MSDIYFTYKDENGAWAPAQNVGPLVNTRGNEVSPFYHPKHQVLYFTSNGHLLNFGSFDIYKSHLARYQQVAGTQKYWPVGKWCGG